MRTFPRSAIHVERLDAGLVPVYRAMTPAVAEAVSSRMLGARV